MAGADEGVRGRRFGGKIAVVTGGGRGIGRAVALRLGDEHANVLVADIAADYADEVAAEIRLRGGDAESARLDVTDASSVGRLFSNHGGRHGRIDVLINCPARATDTHFEQITEDEFDHDLGVTLKGPFLTIQAAMPFLLKSRAASVVSIGSVNGLAGFGNEVYGAAKAGLTNLTQNLAIRYGNHGIRFNVVAPGTIRTRSWDARVIAEESVLAGVAQTYPMGRVGTADDVAAATVFLASDEAGWITGVTLPVDGGVTAGNPKLIAAIFGDEFFQTTAGARPRA